MMSLARQGLDRRPAPARAVLLAGCVAAALLAFGSVARAESACPRFFVGGQAPTIAAPPAGQNRVICESGYALEHASAWREPIWSAEHLLGYEVPLEEADKRRPLHPESALPAGERAELVDYRDPRRYGQSHAAPVTDFLDESLRDDAVTLANTIPLNRAVGDHAWSSIERRVRDQARQAGEVYIVTGPSIAAGGPLLGGRVAIPQAAWKAIYVPRTGLTGAFWVANDGDSAEEFITVAELIKRTGVDPFPALSDAEKALPHPEPALLPSEADQTVSVLTMHAHRARR